MPKSWRYALSIICLLILAALLWWTPETDEIISNLGNSTESNPAPYPDAIMDNAYTQQFNTQGDIEYELTSTQIHFFESSSNDAQAYIEYQQPEMIFYGDGESAPIRLTSNKGYSRDDGNTIELTEKVTLTQTLNNKQQYQLTTDALTILPSTQFAETNKPVMITQPSGVTTATGLKANLKQQRFELLSDVRGNYVR